MPSRLKRGRRPLALALMALARCGPCSFSGTAEVITFITTDVSMVCWSPSQPVATGSLMAAAAKDASVDTAETYTSTSSAASVASWSEAQVITGAPGAATLTITSSAGREDSFEVEVADPAAADLLDPLTQLVITRTALVREGDDVWVNPGAHMTLWNDEPLGLWVMLSDADERPLAWSDDAIAWELENLSVEEHGTYEDVRVRGTNPGPGSVRMSSGATGAELAHVVVDVTDQPVAASLELGAASWPEDDNRGTFLRALARIADGDVLWQAPVEWTRVGSGDVTPWRVETACEPDCPPAHRPDIAGFSLTEEDDPDAFAACITASLEGPDDVLVRSASLDPTGVHFFDGVCDGCACSSKETSGWMWAVVAMALLRRRAS